MRAHCIRVPIVNLGLLPFRLFSLPHSAHCFSCNITEKLRTLPEKDICEFFTLLGRRQLGKDSVLFTRRVSHVYAVARTLLVFLSRQGLVGDTKAKSGSQSGSPERNRRSLSFFFPSMLLQHGYEAVRSLLEKSDRVGFFFFDSFFVSLCSAVPCFSCLSELHRKPTVGERNPWQTRRALESFGSV